MAMPVVNSKQVLGCRTSESFGSCHPDREEYNEDRVKSISNILQVKKMWKLGDLS